MRDLPRLQQNASYLEPQTGRPIKLFQRFWDTLCKAIEGSLALDGSGAMTGPLQLASYEVADLPAAIEGALVYVSDGRKHGEGAGAGTGVMAFGDATDWCACDTGLPVAA